MRRSVTFSNFYAIDVGNMEKYETKSWLGKIVNKFGLAVMILGSDNTVTANA
jgi:hypothetical protein